MPTQESNKFERNALEFLNKKWKLKLERKTIQFNGATHSFDFVSSNKKYIGDAKYLAMRTSNKIPHAKLAAISEYVWLLEKTNCDHKFLIFGNNKNVPLEWLRRFKTLTSVKFYFLKNNNFQKLN